MIHPIVSISLFVIRLTIGLRYPTVGIITTVLEIGPAIPTLEVPLPLTLL